MRDWSQAFRRASFRGVPFWVDRESPDFGRRVAVHDISGGGNTVEDTGSRIPVYRVDAYVASELADIEGRALELVCQVPGPGFLSLPMDPGLTANCTVCRRDRRKDKNGLIAYDLEFLAPIGAAPSVLGAVPSLRGIVIGAAVAIASSFASVF
ncbi:DNA circularization N-terminal domain-containing protein [Aurantimonas coralicida]|uniref:DNA circularization N-terminal domain-containing protein n=1 Tax=Aurantimonas coralicida TaxID=182270 RepID=UPI001D181D98|nr:DNA circularization N-terminal domain-containing protein [Aurantimonas coralicida]MCC4298547.1 DNA circularization N-terminal domain-containing protein [Aurantimonas coralicida]